MLYQARGCALALTGLAFVLAGCGNGASAVETRDRASERAEAVLTAGTAQAAEAVPASTDARPVVTANSRETVPEKVQRLYTRNGKAFGASSAEVYLDKMTAFTTRPPADAEVVKRGNGDTLIYQASTNTFAVVKSDGTPRTMFKPDDGAAYWAKEKAAAPNFGRRRTSSEE